MKTFRAATLSDLPTLLEFEQALIKAERPFALNFQANDIHYYDLTELIESPSTHLCLIELDNKIVACGYAQIRDSSPHHNSAQHAYLGFMYTKSEHRGRGLNQQLIEHLKQWSLQRGVRHFRLDVFSTNSAAISAYKKSGFKPHLLEMVMQLEDSERD